MTNYGHTAFKRVVSNLLKDGCTPQELIAVVKAAAAESNAATTSVEDPDGYFPIYEAVPAELMTVSDVVEEYGVTRQNVFSWLRAGHVREAALLRYPGSGQRNIPLLRRDEVREWITMDVEGNIQIYDVLPDGLATLATMEEELGINRRTMRAWINRGHLPKKGLLKGAARGGGMILVSRHDVRQLAESKSMPRK